MELTTADFAALADPQRLAVLEALMLVVYADGKVTPEEIRRFDALVSALPWGLEPPQLAALIRETNGRMAHLSTAQAITDFVANLATRLPSQDLREKVLYTMARLADADGVFHPFEKNVLGLCTVSWNITSERLALIKLAVERAGAADRPPSPNAN